MLSSSLKLYSALYLAAFLYALGYGASVYLIPVYATYLKANYYELGLIGMVGSVLYIFFPLLSGWLSDKVNKAHMLSVGLVANIIATSAIALASTVPELLIVRVISGLAIGFYWPIIEALIADIAPEVSRISKIGSFGAATTLGMIIGPPLGGVLAQVLGLRQTFLLSSLPMVAALIVVLSFVIPAYKMKGVVKVAASVNASNSLQASNLFKVAPIVVTYSAFFSTVVSILPGYLSLRGYLASEVGALFSLVSVARVIALLSSHKVGGRDVSALIFFSLTLALSCFIMFFSETLPLYILSLIIMGFSLGFIFPLSFNLALKGIKQELLGRGVGVYESILGVGFAGGPIFSGFIAESIEPKAPYLILGLLCVFIPLSLRRIKDNSGRG
ncbi:MAG: MFS transporter [Nitrososphaerales archaeon]